MQDRHPARHPLNYAGIVALLAGGGYLYGLRSASPYPPTLGRFGGFCFGLFVSFLWWCFVTLHDL